MKDLGVIIDCNLKFHDHIKLKINKAYSMLGILRRNFKEMDVESFISLDGCFSEEFDLCAAPRKTEFDNFAGKEETRGLNRNVQIVNRKGKCGLSAILPEG